MVQFRELPWISCRLYEQQKAEVAGGGSDSDSDMEFDGGYRVPGRIWNKLYRSGITAHLHSCCKCLLIGINWFVET